MVASTASIARVQDEAATASETHTSDISQLQAELKQKDLLLQVIDILLTKKKKWRITYYVCIASITLFTFKLYN